MGETWDNISTGNIGSAIKSGIKNVKDFGAQVGEELDKRSALLSRNPIPLNTLIKNPAYGDVNISTIDVAKNYWWTLTPPEKRPDVPYIELEEYEIDQACLYAQLQYWGGGLKAPNSNDSSPFRDLYFAKRTGTVFKFPYFEEYDHLIGQDWPKTKGLAEFAPVEALLNITTAIAKGLMLAPGTAVNQPQVWSGTNAAEYTINFTLFNTIKGSLAQNQKLKRRLQASTLHDQMGPILASPPAIFTVNIPGIRYSPAAIIRQLTVTNVGQMNLMENQNIPDAYQFTINILELVSESRQILDASIQGHASDFDKVRSITTGDEATALKQLGPDGKALTSRDTPYVPINR